MLMILYQRIKTRNIMLMKQAARSLQPWMRSQEKPDVDSAWMWRHKWEDCPSTSKSSTKTSTDFDVILLNMRHQKVKLYQLILNTERQPQSLYKNLIMIKIQIKMARYLKWRIKKSTNFLKCLKEFDKWFSERILSLKWTILNSESLSRGFWTIWRRPMISFIFGPNMPKNQALMPENWLIQLQRYSVHSVQITKQK